MRKAEEEKLFLSERVTQLAHDKLQFNGQHFSVEEIMEMLKKHEEERLHWNEEKLKLQQDLENVNMISEDLRCRLSQANEQINHLIQNNRAQSYKIQQLNDSIRSLETKNQRDKRESGKLRQSEKKEKKRVKSSEGTITSVSAPSKPTQTASTSIIESKPRETSTETQVSPRTKTRSKKQNLQETGKSPKKQRNPKGVSEKTPRKQL